jgi:hypothetical protein
MDFCSYNSINGFEADPCKRVNFTLGLVLGEDEFRQEQGYFIKRRRLHNRLLHGWGTASGLAVKPDDPKRVLVTPGWAVDPQGREIRISRNQCADLDAWMGNQTNADAITAKYPGTLPIPLPLYILLGYRECPTDNVPVPGEPCRPEEECVAPSRISESFDLKLSLVAPVSADAAIMDSLRWFLSSIDVSSISTGITEDEALTQLEEAVRAIAAGELLSPPASIILLPEWIADAIERIMRVWITEVTPIIENNLMLDPGENKLRDYVSLGRIDSQVQNIFGKITLLSYTIDQANRPLAYRADLLEYITASLARKAI